MIRANATRGLRALLLSMLLLTFAASAQAASPAWKVMGVTGPTNLPPVADEIQRVTLDATGGTFTLSFEGQTTAPLAFDATPAQIEAALNGLSSVAPNGSVEVEGGPGGPGGNSVPYFVRFGGSLSATNVIEMTSDSSGLTGGAATATVSTKVEGATPGAGEILVTVANVGGAASSGPVTLDIGPLPAGITISATPTGPNWSCPPTVPGQTSVSCHHAGSVGIESVAIVGSVAKRLTVPISIDATASPSSSVPISVEGGGAGPAGDDEHLMPLTVSAIPAPAGLQVLWAGAFDEDGEAAIQAGAHPARAGAFFRLNTIHSPSGQIIPAGDLRDVEVTVPPGFVGNPTVTPKCPQESLVGPFPFGTGLCPYNAPAAIGQAEPMVQSFAANNALNERIYNNVPKFGYPAQFTFPYVTAQATLVGSLRSDGDYGVTVTALNVPIIYKVFGAFSMLNGNPPGAAGKAFLTNPTGCSEEAQGSPITEIGVNTWQAPTLFDRETVAIPPVSGCHQLEFGTPEVPVGFSFQPETKAPASTTAATAHLHIDQAGLLGPNKLATPHLKRSVVTLPEGIALNPSAADGLETCSTEQIGLMGTGFAMPNPIRFDKSSPRCPDASKVGTVQVKTPLLENPLNGVVYLADQGDNPFGSLVAIYLAIDDPQTGTVVKLPGEVRRNAQTGQITAVFDHNPQLPFEDLTLQIRGGARSSLATPDTCGTHTTNGTWTPWSAPESGPPATTSDSFAIQGANCPTTKAARPFDLSLSAGASDPAAGKHSPFRLRLTRPDGNQELSGVTLRTPPGFAATLKGVASCSDAALSAAASRDGTDEIASPSCPASSQIGTTTIGAGVGSNPIYVKTGKAYLAGPYKGAPLSLAFVVPAVAGPFDLGVQVVRTALHVDPRTAQITAVSDPIPQILEGVPLQIREVRVDIDRANFTLNPTNCEQMAISAEISGGSGAIRSLSERFQVGGCENLGFKPKLNLRLKGGTKRGDNPKLIATLKTRAGDANIAGTRVTLPRSAFLDQAHIRTVCTRVQFAADQCPKGSIYGRATATTPLLDYPISGIVYLRSSDNELPDIVADLRGPAQQPIRIELVGKTDSVKGALRNTFDIVPDAPATRFRLELFGGKRGLVVNSRDICRRKYRVKVEMDAHNGRESDTRPVLRNDCKRKGRKGNKSRKR